MQLPIRSFFSSPVNLGSSSAVILVSQVSISQPAGDYHLVASLFRHSLISWSVPAPFLSSYLPPKYFVKTGAHDVSDHHLILQDLEG